MTLSTWDLLSLPGTGGQGLDQQTFTHLLLHNLNHFINKTLKEAQNVCQDVTTIPNRVCVSSDTDRYVLLFVRVGDVKALMLARLVYPVLPVQKRREARLWRPLHQHRQHPQRGVRQPLPHRDLRLLQDLSLK